LKLVAAHLLAGAVSFPVAAFAAMTCESLATLKFGDAVVTGAEHIASGTFNPPSTPPTNAANIPSGPVTGLPPFCRVTFTIEPTINVELWLPDVWNRRFRAEGNGDTAGRFFYDLTALNLNLGLARALRKGYATANTDTGHQSTGGGFALNVDGTLNWQLIDDFAWRSNHEMTVKSKAIIKAYYGSAPAYSYWHGCSTGGRQGLMEIQQFPDDYDGLEIGAPAINWDRFIPSMLWGGVVMNNELGTGIATTKLTAVTADAINACDANDAVVDGVLNDPRKCTYDPAQSICKAGQNPSVCLTPQEANVVRKMWDGPADAKGNRLWFGWEIGTRLSGSIPGQSGLAQDWFRYWVNQSTTSDWRTMTESDFVDQYSLGVRKFNEVIGTDDDNLQRFRKAGRKFIMWHGEADGSIPPRGSINYFERLQTGNGGKEHVNEFARLYMAPGVGHCSGAPGQGPNSFVMDDKIHDVLVDWVENGVAPDRIVTARTLPNGTVQSRPLCPYPTTAKWTGLGSTDVADNFVCADGENDATDFRIKGPGPN